MLNAAIRIIFYETWIFWEWFSFHVCDETCSLTYLTALEWITAWTCVSHSIDSLYLTLFDPHNEWHDITINCPIVTCMELFPLYELVCDKKYANAASFEKYLKLLLSTDHCSLALYALEWLVGESKARVYSRHWCELVVPFVLNGVISSGNIESSESPTVM